MPVVVAWSSIYLQLSSFNFMCSGLFSDIICLRWFLSNAYFWLFMNAVTGFPNYNELWKKPGETFLLHYDVLFWSIFTFYVHFTKLLGLIFNEKKVHLPEGYKPLWRMLYRNGGLSELLFKQFIMTKFSLVKIKKGSQIPTMDNSLYMILDGTADATITLQGSYTASASTDTLISKRQLFLCSGDIINIKYLNLFRAGSESEAFANQTVEATATTDMTCYRIHSNDIYSLAKTGQLKNAYQGLLIFALTAVAEKEIMDRHFDSVDDSKSNGSNSTYRELGKDKRDVAFKPLEKWEEPNPLISGSGGAWDMPLAHFRAALKNSFKPPPPLLTWIPGLRHSMLPAPHYCPPEEQLLSKKDEISSLTQDGGKEANEKTPLV